MSATDSTDAAIAAITNLLGRYCHVVDAEPIEAITTLFWPDASLVAPDGSEHTGADAIAAWATEWDTTMRAPVKSYATASRVPPSHTKGTPPLPSPTSTLMPSSPDT